MGKRKTVLWMFREYEADAFARYLEEMAKKGWYLKSLPPGRMHFVSGAPRKLKFEACVLCRDLKNGDMDEWEAAQSMIHAYEEAGWTRQYNGCLWQVFYTEELWQEPVRRDLRLELERQKSVTLSLRNIALAVAAILLELWMLYKLLEEPGRAFAFPGLLFCMMVLVLIMLAFPCYFGWAIRWYRRAAQVLEETGKLPAIPLKRVKWKNRCCVVGTLVLFLLLFAYARDAVSQASLALIVLNGGIIFGVFELLIWFAAGQSYGDSDEDYRGFMMAGVFIAAIFMIVSDAVAGTVFAYAFEESEPAYERKGQFPVDFADLGYTHSEDWYQDSERSFLAFYQRETGERNESEKDTLTMEYYESWIPPIISWTRNTYPWDNGNVWEVTVQDLPQEEEDVSVVHYRYELKDLTETEVVWHMGTVRDSYAIYDENRMLVLMYSVETEAEAIEPAVTGFGEARKVQKN